MERLKPNAWYCILMVLWVSILSCHYDLSATPRSKAIDTVQKYLHNNLNDPGSYDPVSFGSLKPIFNDDTPADSDSTKFLITGYTINHTYRASNEFGATTLYKEKFVLTAKLKFVEQLDLTK